MYAIETELGRFEAETERDAKKAMRAAMRIQDAKDADENRKYQIARDRAGYQAYCMYERKADEKAMPPGWRYKQVSGTNAVQEVYRDHQRGYRINCDSCANTWCSVFPYDAIVGYVENGAGFCIAVAIEKQDCELFAVGACEDRLVWVPMAGIKINEFVAR